MASAGFAELVCAGCLRATVEAEELILAVTPEDEAVAVSFRHVVDTDQSAAMISGSAEVPESSQIARDNRAVIRRTQEKVQGAAYRNTILSVLDEGRGA